VTLAFLQSHSLSLALIVAAILAVLWLSTLLIDPFD
jgi:hypothetical protein